MPGLRGTSATRRLVHGRLRQVLLPLAEQLSWGEPQALVQFTKTGRTRLPQKVHTIRIQQSLHTKVMLHRADRRRFRDHRRQIRMVALLVHGRRQQRRIWIHERGVESREGWNVLV